MISKETYRINDSIKIIDGDASGSQVAVSRYFFWIVEGFP